MTVITEAELREMWQGGRGTIAPLPRGVRFTPSAKDFINQWNIEICYLEEAKATPAPNPITSGQADRPAWDKPGEFPVRLEGPVPVCAVCGQPVTHKPGHLAQLDAGHFAPKTAPQFLFRGKMDTVHAHFLLAAAQARGFNLPDLSDRLSTLAAYCREITSAEYNKRKIAPLQLAGLSATDIHQATHNPKRTLGIGHVVPGPNDHELLLQLNLLRSQVREAELTAAHVFTGPDGQPTRPDLTEGLNKLSSAVYYLILLFKAGKFSWKIPIWPEKASESQ